MDSLHLDLSPAHIAFLDEQVAAGGHRDVGAYVTTLIDAEARARARDKLEALLLEGLEGETVEWTPELMDEIRRKAGLIA